jgi:hypothetical protein
MTRHLADEEKRRVTQLHLLAGLGGKRSDLLGRDLGHQFGNATGDLDSLLVELLLSEEAG